MALASASARRPPDPDGSVTCHFEVGGERVHLTVPLTDTCHKEDVSEAAFVAHQLRLVTDLCRARGVPEYALEQARVAVHAQAREHYSECAHARAALPLEGDAFRASCEAWDACYDGGCAAAAGAAGAGPAAAAEDDKEFRDAFNKVMDDGTAASCSEDEPPWRQLYRLNADYAATSRQLRAQ